VSYVTNAYLLTCLLTYLLGETVRRLQRKSSRSVAARRRRYRLSSRAGSSE